MIFRSIMLISIILISIIFKQNAKNIIKNISNIYISNIIFRKKCIKTKFDRKTHQAVEELDDDKFVSEFTKATVKGWRGLKLKYLEEILLVDLKNNDPETELEFNFDNAVSLVSSSTDFDNWINEVVFDLANFRRAGAGDSLD